MHSFERTASHARGARTAEPDATAEPEGFVVEVGADRIHFLDWGGARRAPGVLLIHGLAQTAWSWAPVARRLLGERRVVAMDLRGHGLSDSPTHGYDPASLASDVEAVAEGSGIAASGLVLAGHGFGACVAAWTASRLGGDCGGLVLVDGGIEDAAATGETPDDRLGAAGDPPEVLRSMAAFLADRRSYDPGSWDADQERAARATVVAVPAGHVVQAIHPHALEASVRALFEYHPREVFASVFCPVVAILAGSDTPERAEALNEIQLDRERATLPRIEVVRVPEAGHNLMRYRPALVAAAILRPGR